MERRTLRRIFGLLCGILLLLAACGDNGAGAAPTEGPGASGPNGDQQTGGYATGGPLALGGTVDAFTAQFGQPAQDNGSSVSYKPQCGADSQTWCAKVDTLFGYDGLRHVAVVTLQSQPQWDRATGLATCEKYLPPDAQLTNEQVTSAHSFARTYHAASLQNIFPDNTFNNIKGEDIAPGTLHIQYTYPSDNDSAHIASCIISIGAPGA